MYKSRTLPFKIYLCNRKIPLFLDIIRRNGVKQYSYIFSHIEDERYFFTR